MLRRFLNLVGSRSPAAAGPPDLPAVPREQITHMLQRPHGLPHVDWDMARAWIADREPSADRHALWIRSVAAAWLDELRDSLTDDHRRWRHATVEGLGPLEDNLSHRAARAANHAISVIQPALRPVRGDAPIPPVAVISLRRSEDYYSFISRYYPDEGEYSTSGGVYIHEEDGTFPLIVMPMNLKWAVDQTVAHEMTHHALHGMGLPLWVEEGFTQMMEERVTGANGFVVNREMMDRNRERWDPENGDGLARFLSGESFHSPDGDEQELSYHLAQLVVRGMLEQRPAQFFSFVRACGPDGVEAAANEHCGMSTEEMVARVLHPI